MNVCVCMCESRGNYSYTIFPPFLTPRRNNSRPFFLSLSFPKYFKATLALFFKTGAEPLLFPKILRSPFFLAPFFLTTFKKASNYLVFFPAQWVFEVHLYIIQIIHLRFIRRDANFLRKFVLKERLGWIESTWKNRIFFP